MPPRLIPLDAQYAVQLRCCSSCIRAKFTDLCYEGTKGEWRPVGSVLFGNASVIEFNSDTGSFENLLYVQEDVSDTKEQLETKLDNPDEIILDRICDEVFGDG